MELVIVADPADLLASEVAHLAKEHGHTATIVDVCTAARLFSIHVHAGQATIEPDYPLFLRIPPQPVLRTSYDASFQYGECLATLWTVAVLSRSTVINRPDMNGLLGRSSYSAALTELRGGITEGSVEVFAKDIPAPPNCIKGQWYIQDTVTHEITAWPAIPRGEGPYRARWANPDSTYEVVVVLGQGAWRCTPVQLEHLELEHKSVSLVTGLNLSFGAVTWRISQDLSYATLVQVNPFPSMNQAKFVWPVLGAALMKEFFS